MKKRKFIRGILTIILALSLGVVYAYYRYEANPDTWYYIPVAVAMFYAPIGSYIVWNN
jgi:hypothetical protein